MMQRYEKNLEWPNILGLYTSKNAKKREPAFQSFSDKRPRAKKEIHRKKIHLSPFSLIASLSTDSVVNLYRAEIHRASPCFPRLLPNSNPQSGSESPVNLFATEIHHRTISYTARLPPLVKGEAILSKSIIRQKSNYTQSREKL